MADHGVAVARQNVGVLQQSFYVHETVVVNFEKELDGVLGKRRDLAGNKLEHEHRLERQVVVSVDEVLLQDVAERFALLLQLSLLRRIPGVTEQEHDRCRKDFCLRGPRLSDGLPELEAFLAEGGLADDQDVSFGSDLSEGIHCLVEWQP